MHPMDALLRPPTPTCRPACATSAGSPPPGRSPWACWAPPRLGAGPVDAAAGDPSQWGVARSVAGGKDPELPTTPGLTRKVNEYEGQHRRVNEYEGQHRRAGQDPEVPVSPN